MMLQRHLLRLAGRVRGPVAACVAIGLVVFALNVAQAVLVGVALGRVLDGRSIGGLAVLMVAVLVVRAGAVWLRELLAVRAAGVVKTRLRDLLVARVLSVGPGYFDDVRSGEVQSSVVDGVEGLEAYYSRYLPQAFVCLTGPVAVAVWIATRDLAVGAVVAVGLVAVPLVPRWWDRLLRSRGQDHWGQFTELHADFLDAMQGMPTLKAVNAVSVQRERLEQRSQSLFRATMRQMAVSLVDTGLTELFIQVGTAVAVAVGAWQVAGGALPLDTLLVLLVLVGVCFRPFRELSMYWHAGFLGVSAAGGITRLLEAQPPSPDRPDAVALTPADGLGISFRDVTLRYASRPEPALDGVSFDVSAGQRVAVVGRSGAGKSSLVGVLMRFRPPDGGSVEIAGRDIAAATGDSVRDLVALVSQDTYLFAGTIEDNLRMAHPDATFDEIVRAATDAGIHDHVAGLPDGYATVVGERGLTLSGGQRQRLAIARALLKDAPILVLDEATSAIDAAKEAEISAALDRLAAGRTTLVIAHRLNTVRNADRIVVLDRGRVVDSGTHDELVTRGGLYAELVRSQTVTA
ncbi:MAG TPA: ABC transporter ATP-binding protein [Ilumatobacter sp.]|nr:ABC transporter ATP-binding protein [Ilumatobacter sp.]